MAQGRCRRTLALPFRRAADRGANHFLGPGEAKFRGEPDQRGVGRERSAKRARHVSSEYQRTLAFSDQLRSYHRHRLAGIHAETYGQVPAHQAMREGRAVPVYGLSFLTAF